MSDRRDVGIRRNAKGSLEVALYLLGGLFVVPLATFVTYALGLISLKLAFVILVASLVIYNRAHQVAYELRRFEEEHVPPED